MRHKHDSYKMVQSVGSCDPCARLNFGEKGLPMDIHLVVKYAVHHSKAVLAPYFFQCWPVSTVEQGSHIAGAIKLASDIAGTPALNHFDFLGVALSVWIPHW